MVVQPKVKGFMCTTAHPEGCKESVRRQIEYVKSQPKAEGPKKVLVLGASMGYGLASRIALTYACGADSIGVIFDKPGKEKRTASAGWYNTAAFEQFAQNDGHYAKSINGDAYSQEIKEETIALIKKDFGQVDMVIYSLAAPRRKAPDGVTYRSVLKTVDKEFTNQSIDLLTNELTTVTIPPATEEEINDTIKVMGGEDWMLWMEALQEADVLADGAKTVAYSYIGPELTYPIYYDGSIGQAKQDLYRTADKINEHIQGTEAYVAVNKAVVTQSSNAIPIVPLYYAKERPVINLDGNIIMADDDRLPEKYRDQIEMKMVRFRTLGCWPLTGAVESGAATIEEIVEEMMTTTKSERTTRVIDFDQEGSMEQKKREGYF